MDPEGKVIGLGEMGDGSIGLHGYSWNFEMTGLPNVPFYDIEVANRGAVAFDRDDLRGRDFTVALTIG